MNLCFLMGNIVDDIKFDFIINGKNNSIVNFKLQILNNYTINIISFDKNADYCYRKLKKGDRVLIFGKLSSKINKKYKTNFEEETQIKDNSCISRSNLENKVSNTVNVIIEYVYKI